MKWSIGGVGLNAVKTFGGVVSELNEMEFLSCSIVVVVVKVYWTAGGWIRTCLIFRDFGVRSKLRVVSGVNF
jgi:hypothetical protein